MPLFESTTTMLILWAAIGYLIGSVPFGILVTRAMGLGDVRAIGSGNIGATNVLRTGNKSAAALTLLLDAGKGIAAVLIARTFAAEDAVQLAALMAFLGHCLPIWLGFKGGKGVATFIGIALALSFPMGLMVCATWLAIAVIFRFSSLAALMAAGLSPMWAMFAQYGQGMVLCLIFAILIYWRHWANIKRMRAGTEPKIGAKS